MKFLIDAQLPRRLVKIFNEFGYEAIHRLDLPQGNTTQDEQINNLSIGYVSPKARLIDA